MNDIYKVYKLSYEAGKQDVIGEANMYHQRIYGNICGALIGMKEAKEITVDVYEAIMNVIDIAFNKERKDE